MHITWYGHAAFVIETQGLRIILDPYRSPDSGGYLPIDEPADLVIVSHENDRYHSHLGQILPPFEVIRALELPEGGQEFKGLRVQAIHVFETPERKPEDEVTVVQFEAEGLPCFPGRPGPLTHRSRACSSPRRRHRAGRGRWAADHRLPRNTLLARRNRSPVVLPMHYKTPKINLRIQPLERFLEALPADKVVRAGSSSLEITRDSLPEQRTIMVLDHAR